MFNESLLVRELFEEQQKSQQRANEEEAEREAERLRQEKETEEAEAAALLAAEANNNKSAKGDLASQYRVKLIDDVSTRNLGIEYTHLGALGSYCSRRRG